MEMVYQYLTGPQFRHRIDVIVEKFSDMQSDLDRERKAMVRIWAKREEQLKSVIDSSAGLYGDLSPAAHYRKSTVWIFLRLETCHVTIK